MKNKSDLQVMPKREREYIRWYPTNLAPAYSENVLPTENSKLAFYVHIPFCLSLCKYCPFTKYVWKEDKVENYVKTLIREIKLATRDNTFETNEFTAGYLGGGTPTSMTTEQLIRLTDAIYENLNFVENSEFTIEANPDTVTMKKLMMLKLWGYNRISFGVQSFDDNTLQKIGRSHKAKNAIEAICLAKNAGFKNVGIDLLYNVPGQTLADWEHQLIMASQYDVQHISTYSLYIPSGTALCKEAEEGRFHYSNNEALEMEFYQLTKKILKSLGYVQYTAYDFAKPGKECVHHEFNWKAPQGEYRSFGVGAFSYLNHTIFCNYGKMETYMNCIDQGKLPVGIMKEANLEEQMSRYLVLGFKYLKVEKEPFQKEFGRAIEDVFSTQIKYAKSLNWMIETEKEYQLTSLGEMYIGNISKLFFAEGTDARKQPRAPMD